ncbi:MAG: ATP-binding protein [Nitrospirae bacterium]|nr:ATP-binding protein [Nitrospirota bacterium]
MERPLATTSDWTKNWQTSIAVKITATVLYAVAAVGFAVAIFLMRDMEGELNRQYDENADRFALRAAQELYPGTAATVQEAAAALQSDVARFGFDAITISRDGETVHLGDPPSGSTSIHRRLFASPGGPEGQPVLLLTFFHRSTHDHAVSHRNALLAGTGAATLVFGFFLTWVILKFISRPIRDLINANKAVMQGDLTVRLNGDRQDEFGALANFFDRMIDQIQQELTVRKQAEELLRQNEEHVKNILDSIHAGIVVIDYHTHEIVQVNSFAAEMIGAPKEEIVGRACHLFVCPAGAGYCPITDGGETVDNSERILITAQGDRVPILKSVVQLSLQGRPLLIESFISIKDRKLAEEQIARSAEKLRETNEELKSFVYSVSHDLRAPLVNVKGFTVELERSLREALILIETFAHVLPKEKLDKLNQLFREDVAESAGFIGSSIDRMDGLIGAMLKLSRFGGRELRPESIDLAAFMQFLLATFAHQIDQKRATVTIGTLPVIVADRTAMEQIMGNLLDNALKYLEPGRPGRIEITAERSEKETIVRVKDNGRGIAEDDIQKVFEIFRRAGKQDVAGEGMGLAYVKTLVKSHDGRIWCESEPGIGTVFSFTIPDKSAPPGEKAS